MVFACFFQYITDNTQLLGLWGICNRNSTDKSFVIKREQIMGIYKAVITLRGFMRKDVLKYYTQNNFF